MTAAASRVVVLGSINMDLVLTCPRRPGPGETVLGDGFATVPGGKGANQAVAAARAGADVRLIGALGDDAFAAQLRETLTDAGVDIALVRTVPGPSGVAGIVVDEAGENSIVVVAGANDAVGPPGDAEAAAIDGARILLCQLEIPIDAVLAAAARARAGGTLVALNPSPARALPDALWTAVDIAVVNTVEADQYGQAIARVPHLVTTLGADGVRYRGPDGAEVHVPAPTVTAVDTTGAGDAFTGALVADWHRGVETALARAVIAGALAATRHGAIPALPTRAEVDRALGLSALPRDHP
ncbi:ribokinase [Nocardia thailandica]